MIEKRNVIADDRTPEFTKQAGHDTNELEAAELFKDSKNDRVKPNTKCVQSDRIE